MKITVDWVVLVAMRGHAVAAARIVAYLDDGTPVIGQLGDHVDTLAHALAELLAEPHQDAPPVLIARPSDDDEVTEVRPCPSLPTRRYLAGGGQ